MTAIDKKALEAAWGEYLNGDKGRLGFRRAVKKFLEHPEAGLVERSELHKEIEQCHAKATCCCGDDIKGHLNSEHSPKSMYDWALESIEKERDEARVKLWKALDERDEARAQVKALREVLARAKKLVGAYNNELQRMGHTAEARQPTVAVLRDARAVLTDTAKAAAQYQRVPEGWHVVQLTVDEDVSVDASNPVNPEAGEEG